MTPSGLRDRGPRNHRPISHLRAFHISRGRLVGGEDPQRHQVRRPRGSPRRDPAPLWDHLKSRGIKGKVKRGTRGPMFGCLQPQPACPLSNRRRYRVNIEPKAFRCQRVAETVDSRACSSRCGPMAAERGRLCRRGLLGRKSPAKLGLAGAACAVPATGYVIPELRRTRPARP